MANFVLKKNLPVDKFSAQNVGHSWIINNNEVWASSSSRVSYSSDFGVSFSIVLEPLSPEAIHQGTWAYRFNNFTYAVSSFDGKLVWYKWNGALFNEIHTEALGGTIHTLKEINNRMYFTTDISRLFIEQNGDTVVNIVAYDTGDLGGIVESGGDVYYERNDSPMSMVHKWDGVIDTVQFTHQSTEWYGEFYDFGGVIYYYDQLQKELGTINILTGGEIPNTVLPEAAVIPITVVSRLRQVNGELNFIVGIKTPTGAAFDGVRTYQLAGTFSKVFEDLNGALGDSNEYTGMIVFGNFGNTFYESICTIVYIGASKTNETAMDADDGSITHDVDISVAVGTVNYRLLDDNEVEVVTWQVSPIFLGLAPGNYLLESRDDTCTIRFNQTVSVLEFINDPDQQAPARTRDQLNTPCFTRVYQIFGMTLFDFQDLMGDLPPPIDEVTGMPPIDDPLRVSTTGDQRIATNGDRRITD